MEEDNKRVVGGKLYEVVLRQIVNSGVYDMVSGDVYISHQVLRQSVLGTKCRVPEHSQLSVIRELVYLEFIMPIKKAPSIIISCAHSESFYSIPSEIVVRYKKDGVQKE